MEQIQQKENDIQNLNNYLSGTISSIEAENIHNRVMTEKDKEVELLKQKCSEFEKQFNEAKNENEYFIKHFDRALSTKIKSVKRIRRSKDYRSR